MAKVRSSKLYLNVRDDRDFDRRQSSIINFLTDGNELYSNEYGKTFTKDEIGSFGIDRVVDNGEASVNINFVPIDGRLTEYTYGFLTYDTKKEVTVGSEEYIFGNTVKLESNSTSVSAGIGTTVTLATIDASTYTSAKAYISIQSSDDSIFECNEINLVHNGSEVYFSEFGRITISNDIDVQTDGIGTYSADFNGTNIDISFYPNSNLDYLTSSTVVSIANTTKTVTNSKRLVGGDLESENVGLASTTNPVPTALFNYSSVYNYCYLVVQITDVTNNRIQFSEIVILNGEVDSRIIEYGVVYSDVLLGTFESNSASITELIFTPIEDVQLEFTILKNLLTNANFGDVDSSIDLLSGSINSGSTLLLSQGLSRDFNLTYNDVPIFERRFNAQLQSTATNPASVDLNRNVIYLPNHFFVSGERIDYEPEPFKYIDIVTATTTSPVNLGDTLVSINDTSILQVNDYILNNNDYIKLTGVGANSVSLAGTITQAISSGVAVTFSRLFDAELEFGEINNISAIPIENTFIAGVGVTNKLSGEIYAYKLDDNFIGFATSPTDALSSPPNLIKFIDVGIGINHFVRSFDQNSKSLILIDNIVQSPVVATAITSSLAADLNIIDNTLAFTGITSFFSGDLIQIDNEIMRVIAVGTGVAGTSVSVIRPFLGTVLDEHSQNATITKLKGNYTIRKNILHLAEAPFGPIKDDVNGDVNIKSTFQGRVFLRSGDILTGRSTYDSNYVFDDISELFDAKTKDFTLTSENQSVTGFSTQSGVVLINNVFQIPQDDYNFTEALGQTEINFTGTATSIRYDVNNASIPRGGVIVAAATSNGFGYQPLVSAGGTAIVSIAGTIQSISIGNSGSGYRFGLQPTINVGVQTYSGGTPNIEFIGTAAVSNGNVVSIAITNPGSGYTSTNPPEVVFDAPLSYSNLNLSVDSGIGTEATIDIVVGQGSSVIDFNIKNFGYSYDIGDVLTVESGGSTGIPTDSSLPFQPFQLTVERVFVDDFSGWSLGELEPLDPLDDLFNGDRVTFPIQRDGNRFAIIKRKGKNIDLKAVLLIFINDILQEPDVAYRFDGGSTITFTEAPKEGDKGRILFYKGTPGIDVVNVDLLETIQIGDKVKLVGDKTNLVQEQRLVTDIILPDVLETNPYISDGIVSDNSFRRSINWYRQRNDLVVNKVEANKSRVVYEPYINPECRIIESVGIGTTQIYVDSVKTIFDPENEDLQSDSPIVRTVQIIDDNPLVSAAATAIVSIAGTIQSVVVSHGGVGYSTSSLKPEISASIQYPIGVGKTGVAKLKTNLVSGSIDSIDVVSPGFGYSQSNPPKILIEERSTKSTLVSNVSYRGDFGIITGIGTTNVGVSTGLVFDLLIPTYSYLRNFNVNAPITTVSGIGSGYFFKVSNSNVGFGLTSFRQDGSIIGIGTNYIDNIYQAISVSFATTSVFGESDPKNIARVTVSVSDTSNLNSLLGSETYFGDYSWGIIEVPNTIDKQYDVYPENGVIGLNTTPLIRRFNRLRFSSYNNT